MIATGTEQFWLVRSNPRSFSWESVLKKGYFTLRGIKNFQAAKSISSMKPGDKALFYEIEPSKSIRGILQVAGNPYPDPSLSGEKFYAIDFHLVESLDFDFLLQISSNTKITHDNEWVRKLPH